MLGALGWGIASRGRLHARDQREGAVRAGVTARALIDQMAEVADNAGAADAANQGGRIAVAIVLTQFGVLPQDALALAHTDVERENGAVIFPGDEPVRVRGRCAILHQSFGEDFQHFLGQFTIRAIKAVDASLFENVILEIGDGGHLGGQADVVRFQPEFPLALGAFGHFLHVSREEGFGVMGEIEVFLADDRATKLGAFRAVSRLVESPLNIIPIVGTDLKGRVHVRIGASAGKVNGGPGAAVISRLDIADAEHRTVGANVLGVNTLRDKVQPNGSVGSSAGNLLVKVFRRVAEGVKGITSHKIGSLRVSVLALSRKREGHGLCSWRAEPARRSRTPPTYLP